MVTPVAAVDFWLAPSVYATSRVEDRSADKSVRV